MYVCTWMHSAAARGKMVYVRFLIWWSGGVMVNELHHDIYCSLLFLLYNETSIMAYVLSSAKTKNKIL